ncbi:MULTISPECIES: hypothetical protein [Bacillus]|uniref:hypothetical protein n=1 Tax=Bacillus TaxID=1386 RepID=UPI0001DA5DEC|nr:MULTISPECIES: hypothetical protein [Bacillus]EFI65088.1 AraC family transcriptional regulator [Bacillus cereus SJ1]MBR9656977.1 AraC family transcriptional regulator [Bacillus cereus]MCU4899380.1 AraC family transcriptional regulator [Bacillus cereus]MCU5313887.1 AraC family transcriptional regulator [Bacillus cereus]MCU5438863.1 AraC family transcriptional regulator [Bacillus cereus]
MKVKKVKEWILGGRNPANYILYNDFDVKYSNEASKNLYSLENHDGYGTAFHFLDKNLYLGKKVKFAGMVMTKLVKEYTGLWIRAEQAGEDLWEFYHIHSDPLNVTNQWKECSVIVDVPKSIEALSVGVVLKGTGHIWFSSMSVEIVNTKND